MTETTPGPIDRFLTDLESAINKHLPPRDSRLWQVSFWAGALVMIVNNPQLLPPGVHIPPVWNQWIINVLTVALGAGGKFGWSSAKAPEKPSNVAG